MKNVLVTGGAGYIGSHTVWELMSRGCLAVVLDDLSTGHLESVRTGHFYKGDIADTALVRHIIKRYNIQSLIHFAGCSQVGESMVKPEKYFYENTVKTMVMVNTAMQAGVKNLVVSSSAAVYGIPQRTPITEKTPLNPVNPYGASKIMIEEYLEWMGRLHGLRWIALRYFNAAGAALDGSMGEDHSPETHLIPLVMQTALNMKGSLSIFGDDYPTPDGTCIRDYIHVMDLASAHIAALGALETGEGGKALNVGSGQGFSVLEIIESARMITGKELPVIMEERRHGDPPALVAECSEIRRVLDWRAQYSDVETILASAWRWHRDHPRGYGRALLGSEAVI